MWYRGMFEFQVALCVGVLVPERPERGGPRHTGLLELMELRQIGTQGVNMKGSFGFFLCWFVGLIVPVQEIFDLPWLL